jgi:integrase
MVYKRGGVYWFEFRFRGVRIRESTHSNNKSVAERIERERHRSLELGTAGLQESKEPLLFSVAAKCWLELNKPHWSASNVRIESYHVDHLLPHFGRMLLTDITADDISRFQAKRKKEHASPRTINMQVGTLRAILRKNRLWANIQPDVRMLKARHDIGRALTEDEQLRLLAASKKSRSRSLYPAIQLSLHSGLRNQELRLLRWRQIDLIEQTVTVGKSKTTGGEGRLIPLSQTALHCLQEWRSLFPDAQPAHYAFPSEIWAGSRAEVRPTVPIGSWKTAWTAARKAAKVDCRWHDMRHTFVSRMAEGQASDATIMSLAGHLSRKMMELYSHTRNEAKRQAISVLDAPFREKKSPQNPPQ